MRYAVWCYGLRFLPTVCILSSAHLFSVIDIACVNPYNVNDNVNNSSTMVNETLVCQNPETEANIMTHSMPQHLNMLFCELYIIGISMSFLFRGHQLWQANPWKKNKLWLKVLLLVFSLQTFYTLFAVLLEQTLMWPPVHVWLIWIVGLPVIIAANEAIKRHEIKVEVRYQKRQRLEFGTKLGINSPF